MSSSSSHRQQILGLLQVNRLDEAMALCARLCEQRPDDAEAWFLLAGVQAQRGALDEVIRCCRRVTALEPANGAAHYNLGVALQTQGHSAEAVESYRQVLASQPDNPLALSNLGVALRELGDPAEAMTCCLKAIELQPNLPEAHNTLGLLLTDQRRFDEAAGHFQRAIALHPGYSEAHYNLGLCRRAGNDLPGAETCVRQAVRLKQDYAEAHVCLGDISSKLRKWDEAITHYRRAVMLNPDFAEALCGLGNALLCHEKRFDYIDEAERCLRAAVQLKPEIADMHIYLAVMLSDLGRLSEAEESYRRALGCRPDDTTAIGGLAWLLQRKGDFNSGYALVKPLVEQKTDCIHVAMGYAALANRFDCRADAAALLERILQKTSDERQKVGAHFALGKLYDEMKEYSKAFDHYRSANKLDATLHNPYNQKEDLRTFDKLLASFTRERVNLRLRASNRSKYPIFIVGMPRSGTSLVEQILSSHRLVHGAGELRDIHQMAMQLSTLSGASTQFPECLDKLNRKDTDMIAQRHLERLGRLGQGAVRVTDKMPQNFLYLGLIDLMFPGSRVIHCMRDPLDTCLSIYFQHFNHLHPYARDLDDLGRYYAKYRKLMAHWKSVLRIPIMEVRYEELVKNLEGISRQLIEFCELQWDDQCLRFHESSRYVHTASYDQVRQPIYLKSVARWKSYEQFLRPLMVALES